MSRIGRKPVAYPAEVKVTLNQDSVLVVGPKGELTVRIPKDVVARIEDNQIVAERKNEIKQTKSDHGTFSATINNAISGVTTGWSKTLELIGTGYRPRMEGRDLVLAIGFSHPVKFVPAEGITFTVEENKVIVTGIDRHLVGQVAANVRAVRPPEVYKGKGIKYSGEKIRRKAGKAAKAGAS